MLVFSLGVGLFLGSVSLARISTAARAEFVPVALAEVSEFRGTAGADSSLSREGQTILHVVLRGVSSARHGLSAQARGRVLVIVPGDYRFFQGALLSFHAPLSALDSPGADRLVARVERKDVRLLGFSSPPWSVRAQAREWVHRAVSRAGYPASALLEALLVGGREDVPDRLRDGFQRTGSLHILALSGLHVVVIFGVVSLLFSFVSRRGLRFALAAAVLVFYQLLAGLMPSLLRATVMILAGGAASFMDRDREPLNLLCISGIVILLGDPFQAFSLSFQLSYLALAGILAIGPLVQRPLEGSIPRFILLPLAMSIGAQVATLPLVVARFGVYYPSGLLAGLILVPLTTAFLWAGLAWLPLYLVPWQALHDLCARVFSLLYDLIDGSAHAFGAFPGLVVLPQAVPWAVGISVIAMLLLGFALPARLFARPRWNVQ
ncbi:MAG TPA: ComEC/Rec2 family competence protein [bacterium]|nr:ComEC/Rec2 family competence protein [bacterium]